ncbi:hypothetical protein QIA27_05620 (plasmid) [Borreliella tanukii]
MVTSALSSIGSAIAAGFSAAWRGFVSLLPVGLQKLLKNWAIIEDF